MPTTTNAVAREDRRADRRAGGGASTAGGRRDDGAIDRIEDALADLFELASSDRLRHRRPGASGLPISAPGHRLLHWLTGHGPASVTQLAHVAELTVPTASRQLHQLEALDCVERRADPDDGRVVVYAATPTGRRAQERFRRIIRDEVSASLAHWSGDDRARLADLLERMMHDFRAGGTAGSLDTRDPDPSDVSPLAS